MLNKELESAPEKKEEKKQESGWVSSVFEWVSAAIVALLVVTIMFSSVFRLVNVSGSSMNPTLQNGERLVISNLAYTPQYGDIVIVLQDGGQQPLIKRVIGLPGDAIRINNDSGVVYRNGEALNEDYTQGMTRVGPSGISAEVKVPKGHLYVLGDNRENSSDSRDRGCQSMTKVAGRVLLRLYPFGKVE